MCRKLEKMKQSKHQGFTIPPIGLLLEPLHLFHTDAFIFPYACVYCLNFIGKAELWVDDAQQAVETIVMQRDDARQRMKIER